jgi:hypothetical protein
VAKILGIGRWERLNLDVAREELEFDALGPRSGCFFHANGDEIPW